MKNFTFLLVAGFLCAFSLSSQAQRGTESQSHSRQNAMATPQRCGVDEMIQRQLATDPVFRARYEEGMKRYEESLNNSTARTAWTTSLTGPVTIPIVFHIVLPNPNIVTDADVLFVVSALNQDYSGFNADSMNASTGYPAGNNFMSIRGHSLIRWALARTDPNGAYTTGIERKVGAGTINGGNPQTIKQTSAGGLDPWDITQYYNVWVGIGSGGLLGIAPCIGPGVAPGVGTDVDGVCVDYTAFSRNPSYTLASYCNARTVVHEIGHNFGLFHTFQNGCATLNDFGSLTGTASATCVLDASLLAPADDTPAQSAQTTNCPSGPTASGCAQSPNPPGKIYQAYMDYTFDPCYSMFTNGEVSRMHYVLENCRSGYLTTTRMNSPASAPALDAALTALVRPGGTEMVGTGRYADASNKDANNNACPKFAYTTYPDPACGGTVTPKVRVQNRGTTTLTSFVIKWSLNAANQLPVTVNGINLPPLYDTVITLSNSVSLTGTPTLKFWVEQPNGSADLNNTNDTITKSYNFGGTPPPVVQDFQSATFPPTTPQAWTILNPNNNNTWTRNANGSQDPGSAAIDNYDFFVQGNTDDVVSPPILVTGLDSLIIKWDLAHKNYPGFNDGFNVRVSTDCGQTFTTVWTRTDPALATAGTSTAPYSTPNSADFVQQRVAIGGALLASGQVIVSFQNVNGFGNFLYIDDINITPYVATPRDVTPTAVLRPTTQECTNSICPSVTVLNNGTQPVTGFQVGYIIDGTVVTGAGTFSGSLAVGASTTVTVSPQQKCLNNLANGAHTFKIFTYGTTGASGGPGDTYPSNDTISKNFTIVPRYATVSADFETTTFPPPFITIYNPNANFTWTRTSPGKCTGSGKTTIDNYSNNAVGQIDELRLAAINTQGVDSVVLSFDLAHKDYPGLSDRLTVYASTDCGTTWQITSYDKADPLLATAGSSTAQYANPSCGDWRAERVALGGSFMTSGSLILAIRNTNGYGNELHIDNINVFRKFKRDLSVTAIPLPKSIICTASNSVQVTVQNIGSDSATSYNIVYQIDNNPVTSTPVTTGLPLPPNATVNVTLQQNATFTPGPHTFTVYTANLVTPSGTGDLNPSNDTLRKTVTFVGSTNPPIVEGLENATFPPSGWGIVNPDNSITWARSTQAASSGTASAFIRNFNYADKGQVDDFVSPNLTYSNVDSVFLSFDLSAASRSYPGSTNIPLDTLEVLVTKDCGNTFTTVWKKWGDSLQTINDPNSPLGVEFAPSGKINWRTESLDLTALGAPNGPFQVYFRNHNNYQNDIYLDNINIKTRTLPTRLKAEGFMVLPSPFNTQFTVWHYLLPTDLKFISVYNAIGQLVWKQEFGGDAPKMVTVDLRNRSAGVYVVRLGYQDPNKNKSVRIVKY